MPVNMITVAFCSTRRRINDIMQLLNKFLIDSFPGRRFHQRFVLEETTRERHTNEVLALTDPFPGQRGSAAGLDRQAGPDGTFPNAQFVTHDKLS